MEQRERNMMPFFFNLKPDYQYVLPASSRKVTKVNTNAVNEPFSQSLDCAYPQNQKINLPYNNCQEN